MSKIRKEGRKAVGLILALGVMAIFSLLGTAFFVMANLFASISRTVYDYINAENFATAGFNAAVAELQTYFAKNAFFSPDSDLFYKGEDLNWNGILDGGEDLNNNGFLDTFNLPVEFSKNYSLSMTVPGGNRTYGFYVKIVDESGKFWVNDPNPRLRSMLNNLARIVGTKINLGDIIVDNRPKDGYKFEAELVKLLGKDEWQKLSQFITLYGWADDKVIEPPSYQKRNIEPYHSVYTMAQLNPGREDIQMASRAPVNFNVAPRPVIQAILTDLRAWYPAEENKKEDIYPATPRDYITYKATPDTFKYGILKEVVIDYDLADKISQLMFKIPKPIKGWVHFLSNIRELADKEISNDVIDLIYANANPNTNLLKFNPDWGLLYVPENLRVNIKNPWYKRLIDKTDIVRNTTEFSFISNGYFSIESLGVVYHKAPGKGKLGQIVEQRKVKGVVKLFDLYRETTQADFSPKSGAILSVTDYPYLRYNVGVSLYPEWHPGLWDKTYVDGTIGLQLTTHKLEEMDNEKKKEGEDKNKSEEDSEEEVVDVGTYCGGSKTGEESKKDNPNNANNPQAPENSESEKDNDNNTTKDEGERTKEQMRGDYTRDDYTFVLLFNRGINADFAKGKKRAFLDYGPDNPKGKLSPSVFDSYKHLVLYPDGYYSEPYTTLSYCAKNNIPEEDVDLKGVFEDIKKMLGTKSRSSSYQSLYFYEMLYSRVMRIMKGTMSFWFKPNYNTRAPYMHSIFTAAYPLKAGQPPRWLNFFNIVYHPFVGKAFEMPATGPSFFWGFTGSRECMFAASFKPENYYGPQNFEKQQIGDEQQYQYNMLPNKWYHLVFTWDTSGGKINEFKNKLKELFTTQIKTEEELQSKRDAMSKLRQLDKLNEQQKEELAAKLGLEPTKLSELTEDDIKKMIDEEDKKKKQIQTEFNRKLFYFFRLERKDIARIYINGFDVTFPLAKEYQIKDESEKWKNTAVFSSALRIGYNDNVFSLGARTDAPLWNFPAHATYDEFIMSNKVWLGEKEVKDELKKGRYFRGPAYFISKKIRIPPNAYKIALVNSSVLITNRFEDNKLQLRLIDGNSDAEAISLEEKYQNLITEETKIWNLDVKKLNLSEYIRYKLDFNRTTDYGTLDTPFFDDVTIVFQIIPQILSFYYVDFE